MEEIIQNLKLFFSLKETPIKIFGFIFLYLIISYLYIPSLHQLHKKIALSFQKSLHFLILNTLWFFIIFPISIFFKTKRFKKKHDHTNWTIYNKNYQKEDLKNEW